MEERGRGRERVGNGRVGAEAVSQRGGRREMNMWLLTTDGMDGSPSMCPHSHSLNGRCGMRRTHDPHKKDFRSP